VRRCGLSVPWATRRTRVPYVVRFRAPGGVAGQRSRFTDAIRGELEHDANRNDAVIVKSSAQSPRLPTHDFAHAVDDHLMRVTLVIRGEEWISSVPLHPRPAPAGSREPLRPSKPATGLEPSRPASARPARIASSAGSGQPGRAARAIRRWSPGQIARVSPFRAAPRWNS
jgi:tRNA synthetases class I (E and Q), catalytic domain